MESNKGDDSELREGPDVINKKLLETAIQSKEGHGNITLKHFTTKPASEKGENYASLTFAVTVTTEERGKEKILNLFVKTLHSAGYFKEYSVQKSKSFFKEDMAYSHIIHDMIRYQSDRGIEPFAPSVPTFYYSAASNETGIVVLQDLRSLGYTLRDRTIGLDEEHCRLVMVEMASFHALSFAIKREDPENLKKCDYLFHEGVFVTPLPPVLHNAWASVIQMVKLFAKDQKTEEFVKKLENFDLENSMKDLIKPVEPFSMICHGDLWCNNMLFKYDVVDKNKPTDVKLVDLQNVRYALPTTDLAFFFFTSVTRATRKQYMDDLLRLYHSSFVNCLKKLDLDFPDFTFQVLQQLFRKTMLFGVISGCLVFPLSIIKPEAIPDTSALSEEELVHGIRELCKQITEEKENILIIEDRLIGTIADAVDMGII